MQLWEWEDTATPSPFSSQQQGRPPNLLYSRHPHRLFVDRGEQGKTCELVLGVVKQHAFLQVAS